MALLEVDNLRTCFHTRAGVVRAVDGVSFSLDRGETLGIVGESGSGKSVTCYSLLRLIPCPPGRFESGRVLLDGLDLLTCSRGTLRQVRGGRVGMIFQDPMTSLNPYLTVGAQLVEPLRLHEGLSRRAAVERAEAALREVEIQAPASCLRLYPHQLSGGMRQRVMIAMALITRPDLLIADEPTTALDVTVQAQILTLLRDLQARYGMAILFVSHDLGVVAGFCDRVAVMYAGKILEYGSTDALFYASAHPYTRALRRSIPTLTQKGGDLYTIPGRPPRLDRPPAGCPFAPRCEFAAPACREPVRLEEHAPGHFSACGRFRKGELPDGIPGSA
jgi:oligopeptide transport system ATP-binding protein